MNVRLAGETVGITSSSDHVGRPEASKAVPVRHWGRWVAAAVVLYLATALIYSMATNPRIDWATVGDYLFRDLTLRGLLVTVELTAVAMLIGVIGGTVLAVMRLSDNPVLSTIAYAYIWFFRGTPVLVQILVWGFLGSLYPSMFLGLPFTGVVFTDVTTSRVIGASAAAILALGINECAYAAELVRAGIISVDKGQGEAAFSLGMSSGLAMRRIVLPQAMRVIVPPLGNETISMLKTTALVSVISGHDLLTNLQLAYTQNFKIIELLVVACFWYLALTTVLSVGQHYLEAHFGRGFGAADSRRSGERSAKREAKGA